jgi:hypothetical protein
MISADDLAIADPVSTEIPTSAARSAGRRGPVSEETNDVPSFPRPSTILCFCAGLTRANTLYLQIASEFLRGQAFELLTGQDAALDDVQTDLAAYFSRNGGGVAADDLNLNADFRACPETP